MRAGVAAERLRARQRGRRRRRRQVVRHAGRRQRPVPPGAQAHFSAMAALDQANTLTNFILHGSQRSYFTHMPLILAPGRPTPENICEATNARQGLYFLKQTRGHLLSTTLFNARPTRQMLHDGQTKCSPIDMSNMQHCSAYHPIRQSAQWLLTKPVLCISAQGQWFEWLC